MLLGCGAVLRDLRVKSSSDLVPQGPFGVVVGPWGPGWVLFRSPDAGPGAPGLDLELHFGTLLGVKTDRNLVKINMMSHLKSSPKETVKSVISGTLR